MADNFPIRRHYNQGSVVMRTDGITHVKTKMGWVPEHRHVVQMRLNRDLEAGEKVFHLDNTLKGEKDFNDPKNLTIIKCRTTKWEKLKHSRLIYEPKKDSKKYKEYSAR